jgi:hypothetical protein
MKANERSFLRSTEAQHCVEFVIRSKAVKDNTMLSFSTCGKGT